MQYSLMAKILFSSSVTFSSGLDFLDAFLEAGLVSIIKRDKSAVLQNLYFIRDMQKLRKNPLFLLNTSPLPKITSYMAL
jgi:hypothetical protein